MGGARLPRDEKLSRTRETLLRAWKHADRLPAAGRRPRLFTTARHLAIDECRARHAHPREASVDLLKAAVEDDSPSSVLAAVRLGNTLHALSGGQAAAWHRAIREGPTCTVAS